MNAGSLLNVIDKIGKINEDIIGMIALQILNGLDYLHKKVKVSHRDIKPSNILLSRDGCIKIADFGVSGNIIDSVDPIKSWVGTLSYMCPDRIIGNLYFSDTDIWSLGIMLMECALGSFPYKSKYDPNKRPEFLELR
jgi:mitogen-activated protein kinase kinase 1